MYDWMVLALQPWIDPASVKLRHLAEDQGIDKSKLKRTAIFSTDFTTLSSPRQVFCASEAATSSWKRAENFSSISGAAGAHVFHTGGGLTSYLDLPRLIS